MKIVVLSTDTEQYLLQWWLPHTANKFDFGVIVDFGLGSPEDNTYDLYKKYVPHWRYYKVTQKEIGTMLWDVILSKVERNLLEEFPNSWITTLNATEFLIGDTSVLDSLGANTQILMPCHLMNDAVEQEYVDPDPTVPLLKQRTFGVHASNDFPHPHQGKSFQVYSEKKPEHVILNTRWMRSIHNYYVDYLASSIYSIGRHYWDGSKMTDKLAICHMNYSPYTNNFLSRKLNVQNRLTETDKSADRGFHHIVDSTIIAARKKFYDNLTIDLASEISRLEGN